MKVMQDQNLTQNLIAPIWKNIFDCVPGNGGRCLGICWFFITSASSCFPYWVGVCLYGSVFLGNCLVSFEIQYCIQYTLPFFYWYNSPHLTHGSLSTNPGLHNGRGMAGLIFLSNSCSSDFLSSLLPQFLWSYCCLTCLILQLLSVHFTTAFSMHLKW